MKVSQKLEEFRITEMPFTSRPGAPYGAFENVPGPCGEKLTIMADDGTRTGWEHVSVSTRKRLPNWLEMSFVKDLFWDTEEVVVQFHPKKSEYVNNFRALHMWRPTEGDFLTPPSILVGFKELGELK
jgi:hypothetical protein